METFLKLIYIFAAIAFLAELEGASVKSTIPFSRRPLPPSDIKFKQESKRLVIDQEPNCNLSSALLNEIRGYQVVANQIINAAISGDFKGRTYNELARFVDKHVNRLTGTPELEEAIDYMMNKMISDGLVNVRGEPVEVPRWIRGEEKATIVEPIHKKMDIIGLGPSVGTNATGINAEVIVVRTFDELDEKKDLVKGKIVVYNQGWLGSYGETVQYRGAGATRAAEYGAVAALVESSTPFSMDTPHTGGTNYLSNVTKIPTACITKEDAELLYRIYSRGEKIVVNLTMLDEEVAAVTSRNIFGELIGNTYPDEIVAVSGHIDAWDVGQGAMDDAGGVLISTEAVALIKHLGLTPKRTLQVIAWTAEEFGIIGAQSFVNQHRTDMGKYNAVFESDSGTFKPLGLDFAGAPEAGCIVQEILKLMTPINATTYARYPDVSSDISLMTAEGVPSFSNNNENDLYFWYHHSPADMLSVIDSVEMDMNTALWATAAYVLADLSVSLPREIPKK